MSIPSEVPPFHLKKGEKYPLEVAKEKFFDLRVET